MLFFSLLLTLLPQIQVYLIRFMPYWPEVMQILDFDSQENGVGKLTENFARSKGWMSHILTGQKNSFDSDKFGWPQLDTYLVGFSEWGLFVAPLSRYLWSSSTFLALGSAAESAKECGSCTLILCYAPLAWIAPRFRYRLLDYEEKPSKDVQTHRRYFIPPDWLSYLADRYGFGPSHRD